MGGGLDGPGAALAVFDEDGNGTVEWDEFQRLYHRNKSEKSIPFDWNCDSTIAAWDALVNAPRPHLAARAEPQLAVANLCEIAATAGYRRLENQLYRVEVHNGGAAIPWRVSEVPVS